MDVLSKLKSIPIFGGFDQGSLEEIVKSSTVCEANPGDRIIEYGQVGEFLGVMLEGEAVASQPSTQPGEPPRELGRLKAGQYFGEMALLTGELTSADVTASKPSSYLSIPQVVFSRTMSLNPRAVRDFAKTLADRLRSRAENPGERLTLEMAWNHAEDPYQLSVGAAVGHSRVLVINCGSSSLKYRFIDGTSHSSEVRGLVERIGIEGSVHKWTGPGGEKVEKGSIANHADALGSVFAAVFGKAGAAGKVDVVGHRVVHGGDRYSAATLIDGDVLAAIRDFSRLAPLHNPNNLMGIEACQKLLPGVPQVAVFDTAFHQTIPRFAHVYGLPFELYRESKLRRYGFHGPSHQYVSLMAATHMGRPVSELKIITCHLGSGASVCAIDHGRSVDTSMGFSPLEGVIMGTRAGDVDPGLVLHLITGMGMTPAQVETMLTKESGLKGISGLTGDMREINEAADQGDPRALLAKQMYAYRVKKYVGAYAAALGDLDVLVFTGGIGENSSGTRARICQGLDRMGIRLDEAHNQGRHGGKPMQISVDGSPVTVLVVPTDEELMIARDSVKALGTGEVTSIIRAHEKKPIPIEVSAHHVHLTQEHVEQLFGKGHELTYRGDLSQPGQFACQETVDLVGPRGRVDKVRVLGPVRPESQVEISRTEEFRLGIDAPVRASGDLDGSPGLTLQGTAGTVALAKGVICALRHIHMSPEEAFSYGLRDRDVVRIKVEGERSLIFGDVLVRVHPSFRLAMHIDTDEANAGEINQGALGVLESIESRPGPQRRTDIFPVARM